MKKLRDPYPDSEDMFADTRMTLGGHIEDLRTHLLRAGYGFLLAMIVSLAIGQPVLRFIAKPVEDQLLEYWQRFYDQKIAEEMENAPGQQLKLLEIDLDLDNLVGHLAPVLPNVKLPMEHKLGVMKLTPDRENALKWLAATTLKLKPQTLKTFTVQEAFVVFIKVCMMTGLVIASPWVFYQIWSFVAAGLYPHEKRLVNVYLPYSIVLFLAGVFLCEFFVIPKAVGALLWFNEWLGMEPDLRLNEWLGFAILMPLVFGISFQTPLVMLFTERIGIFDVPTFRAYRRIAYFVMALISAIIIPATDAVSMLLLAGPMCVLYEFGIWLCVWQEHSEGNLRAPESQEMIEV